MKNLYDFMSDSFDSDKYIRIYGFLDGISKIYSKNNWKLDDILSNNDICLELIRTNIDFRSKNFKMDKSYASSNTIISKCYQKRVFDDNDMLIGNYIDESQFFI